MVYIQKKARKLITDGLLGAIYKLTPLKQPADDPADNPTNNLTDNPTNNPTNDPTDSPADNPTLALPLLPTAPI